MGLKSFGDKSPQVAEGAYVNNDAIVIGDVVVEAGASVWPGAIIRADSEQVVVKKGAAVLDKAFIEAPKGHPVEVGEGALISHGAILHGCVIGKGALVGIRANILEGVTVGECSVVGAGAVVRAGTKVEPYSMLVGVPAKLKRKVTQEEADSIACEVEQLGCKAQEYGAYFVFKAEVIE